MPFLEIDNLKKQFGPVEVLKGIDLEIGSSNIIGGPLAGQRNIISGNDSDGVEIDGGDFNVVQNNFIGTDVTGTLLIPNGRDGIDINENTGDGAMNSLIGGTGANEGNLIRGNGIYGVQVRDAPSTNNTIIRNRIYDNVALDLDLNDDGVSVNDPFDADGDPNDSFWDSDNNWDPNEKPQPAEDAIVAGSPEVNTLEIFNELDNGGTIDITTGTLQPQGDTVPVGRFDQITG